MALRDENIAIGGDGYVGGLVEKTRIGAGDASFAEGHEHLSLGIELEDLHPLAVLRLLIGYPQVALRINRGAVGEDEHVFAPGLEELARSIELENRWLGAVGAGIVVAAMDHVDAAIGGNFDRGDGGPRDTIGRVAPI